MNAVSNRLFAWGKSDVGMKRQRNEDNYTIALDMKLLVVADGMGGHAGGATASRLAVETIEEIVRANQSLLEPDAQFEGPIEQNPLAKLVSDALRCACQVVHKKGSKEKKLAGMGTTTTALLLHDNFAFVAHVGDSRAYIVRNEKLVQLSDDHSLVNEHIKAGIMTQNDAQYSRLRNVITRSIGYESDVDVDITALEVFPKDTFLLCSDGLNSLVTDQEIRHILLDSPLSEAPGQLIDLANQRGGDDNTTIIIGHIPQDPQMSQDEAGLITLGQKKTEAAVENPTLF